MLEMTPAVEAVLAPPIGRAQLREGHAAHGGPNATAQLGHYATMRESRWRLQLQGRYLCASQVPPRRQQIDGLVALPKGHMPCGQP